MSTRKILVVDDDTFVREMITDVITSLGYEVVQAENGREALNKLFVLNHIDLVITDIHMPELDGLGLIDEIRAVDTDTPIIILTVNSEMATAIEAIRKGADDYILKGSSINETLPLSIAKVFEIADLREDNRLLLKDLTSKNAELEKLTFLDGLTGLFNRRYYDLTLLEKCAKAAEQNEYISMIMTDIDHFKLLNDSLGHPYGDLCLQQVAKVISRIVMDCQGIVARFGGDEFVAILPEYTPEKSAAVAERIRQKIMSTVVIDPESGQSKTITMSFGVFGIQPGKGIGSEQLLEGADKALYEAKKQGRNRVHLIPYKDIALSL
ncbi:MAG: diguanylate cyclase [Sphaerochaeta sp.]|nr:diguanylate cyclase [Sphaerochaeta sp.]